MIAGAVSPLSWFAFFIVHFIYRAFFVASEETHATAVLFRTVEPLSISSPVNPCFCMRVNWLKLGQTLLVRMSVRVSTVYLMASEPCLIKRMETKAIITGSTNCPSSLTPPERHAPSWAKGTALNSVRRHRDSRQPVMLKSHLGVLRE